jgi:hypothetical protein
VTSAPVVQHKLPRVKDKALAELLREVAQLHGADAITQGKNHLRIHVPGLQPYFTGTTPGAGPRTLKNVRTGLRRAGYLTMEATR